MCVLVASALSQPAIAADMPSFLRGSTTFDTPPVRWDGLYGGVQAGYTTAGADFANATRSLIQFILRESTIENEQPVSDWQVLGKGDTNASHWGGFIGYQQQWDEVVFGVEANYNKTNFTLQQADAMRRTFVTSDGGNDVQVNGSAMVRMLDYGTFRVRAGWALGNFLPYATAGLVVGRADVTRSVTITARDPNDNTTIVFQQTKTEAKPEAFAYGYSAGLGMDIALMQNLFVRAEYEYIHFGWFNDINLHIHSARLGVGLKF
jgi:opacity protein-like surface antigen